MAQQTGPGYAYRPVRASLIAACVLGLALWLTPGRSDAEPVPSPKSGAAPKQVGHPQLVLDALEFPKGTPSPSPYEKDLRQVLRKEARHMDWGVGRGSTITYRYQITDLHVMDRGDVVTVRCAAIGRLPKGKSARSQLVFSGAAAQRKQIVGNVLQIVARGVLTRLAELERIRRGQLRYARIRPPEVVVAP